MTSNDQASLDALREIVTYEGHYASDKNPTVRAIKRIAQAAIDAAALAHETKPCIERQDAYDAAAEVAVEKINRDAARYRFLRSQYVPVLDEVLIGDELDKAVDAELVENGRL